MVMRSSSDNVLQGKFDDWFTAKGYSLSTKSESRKGKTLNWDSRRTANCWRFFVQGAMEEDGRPSVRCVVCGNVLGHGGFFGPSTMTAHLKKSSHLAKAKEMVYGTGSGVSADPTDEEILEVLKRTGNEGLIVWLISTM